MRRLVSNVRPDSVILPRACRELERAFAVGEHDEAALGAGHLDGRIEHEREVVVEHTARAERAKSVEQRRHLPQLGGGVDRALLR
jgi:hypothetical protein